ncbi:hypothetical protein D9M68_893130 [compost metagenome]
MALDGGAGIDVERCANLVCDIGQAHIFGMKNAVAIFKMIHGKQSLLDRLLQNLVEDEGLVFLRFLDCAALLIGDHLRRRRFKRAFSSASGKSGSKGCDQKHGRNGGAACHQLWFPEIVLWVRSNPKYLKVKSLLQE